MFFRIFIYSLQNQQINKQKTNRTNSNVDYQQTFCMNIYDLNFE